MVDFIWPEPRGCGSEHNTLIRVRLHDIELDIALGIDLGNCPEVGRDLEVVETRTLVGG